MPKLHRKDFEQAMQAGTQLAPAVQQRIMGPPPSKGGGMEDILGQALALERLQLAQRRQAELDEERQYRRTERREARDLAQAEKQERGAERLAKSIEQGDYSKLGAELGQLRQSIQEKGFQTSGVKAATPKFILSPLESMGMVGEGSVAQKEHLAGLQSFVRKGLYGVALTPPEKRDFTEAYKTAITASGEDAKRAVNRMIELYNKGMANLRAGHRPEVQSLYEQRNPGALQPVPLVGGLQSVGIGTQQPPAAPAPQRAPAAAPTLSPAEQAELDQLRQEAAQGKF